MTTTQTLTSKSAHLPITRERLVTSLDMWEDGMLNGQQIIDLIWQLRQAPKALLEGLDKYRRPNAEALLEAFPEVFGTAAEVSAR